MNRLLLAAAAVAASLASTPSHALTFNFSFTNGEPGGVSGTVTGQIFGLADNTANQAATAVDITGAPTGLLLTIPPDLSIPLPAVSNSFTVQSGAITASDFDAQFSSGDFAIELSLISGNPLTTRAFLSANSITNPDTEQNFVDTGGGTPPTFTATATPLPAALPLFATGLGGLGLLGWRRKRKALAVSAHV